MAWAVSLASRGRRFSGLQQAGHIARAFHINRMANAPIFTDVPPSTRRVMQGNKASDTRPEMLVRRLLHGLGYRYRLHRRDLPGRPDLVFTRRKKVIFVHGCFWHAHHCVGQRSMRVREAYWAAKFERNRARDARVQGALQDAGWQVLVLWECELREPQHLARRVVAFLGPARARSA